MEDKTSTAYKKLFALYQAQQVLREQEDILNAEIEKCRSSEPKTQMVYQESTEKYPFTKNQLSFLDTLNNTLIKKEKEIVARYRQLVKRYEKRVRKVFRNVKGDLDDFEIDVIIEYIIPDYDVKFRDSVCLSKEHEDNGLLCSEDDWREGYYYPELKNPMCYTMHCLMYHTDRNLYKWLYRINRIDYEFIIREQQFEKIDGGIFFDV